MDLHHRVIIINAVKSRTPWRSWLESLKLLQTSQEGFLAFGLEIYVSGVVNGYALAYITMAGSGL
jgi:hypothetical protein